MGFLRSLAESTVRAASVFGFLYLAYEMNRSLLITGLKGIKTLFSKEDNETEDSETETEISLTEKSETEE